MHFSGKADWFDIWKLITEMYSPEVAIYIHNAVAICATMTRQVAY